MSFTLHDYPGMPSVCALCGKRDCSLPGEQWVHLNTIEDRPCIGQGCIEMIADSLNLTVRTVFKEVTREPSDDEMLEYIRANFKLEAINHANDNLPIGDIEHRHVDSDGQDNHPPQERAKRTRGQNTGRKPRNVSKRKA